MAEEISKVFDFLKIILNITLVERNEMIIHNRVSLSSQNLRTLPKNKKINYSTNPNMQKTLFNAKLAQSRENLFNFINDNTFQAL